MIRPLGVLLLAVALAAVLPAIPVVAAPFEGPLAVRNQFPLFLPIDPPLFERAETGNSFALSLSHSSVYVVEQAQNWNAGLDLELTELAFHWRRDLPGLFEVGVDLPVLRTEAGFLDRPLSWYHNTFGFPDYGRSERPMNSFLYEVQRNGVPVIEGQDDAAGIGDTRISFKKKLLDVDPIVSVEADVELPTGDARHGFGNGSTDAGIALLVEKDLFGMARLYTEAGAGFPGDLRAEQTIELDDFAYAGAGIEAIAGPRLNLLVQCMAQTSPYPHTGIRQIDNTGLILVMGGRYHARQGSWEFSLTEDPNTSGAPDFILNTTFRQGF